MDPLFISEFGYLCEKPAAQAVLDGTYEPPDGMNPYMIELLSIMKVSPSIRAKGPLDCSITPLENRAAWMSQKERTASEPSSLSFAHHKAASLDEDLNAVDTLLRAVPLHVGFSPKAWQTITDVEILKKKGEYRVSKNETDSAYER